MRFSMHRPRSATRSGTSGGVAALAAGAEQSAPPAFPASRPALTPAGVDTGDRRQAGPGGHRVRAGGRPAGFTIR
jgi:hypothetical protein